MSDFINILLLALLGSVVAMVGGLVFLLVKKWSKALATYSIPFAAGVLMTVALVGLLPEAVHLIEESAFLITLLAILGAYVFETLMCNLHHHDHGDEHTSSVPLVIVGDTIHNLIDGVAIAAAYLITPGLGLITAISTLLHEIPHEIGDFGVLFKAGYSKKKVLIINLLSSLTTVLGALIVYFYSGLYESSGILLSIAAGMFIYLGASDFLPRANEGTDKKKALLVLVLGVILMLLTLSIVPHSHEAVHLD